MRISVCQDVDRERLIQSSSHRIQAKSRLREPVATAECSGVEAMDTGRLRKDHRANARAEQVDPLDQLGAEVAEEMLLDLARTVPLVEGDPVRHEPPIDERLDPVLDQLEADGVGEPVAEAAGGRGAV